MLEIIGRTSVKLTAFLVAACVAAGGISSPAAPTQSGKAAVGIDDVQVPLYSKPAGSHIHIPIASSTTTYKNEKATLNTFSASEGYIMVKYTGSVGKIKIQITKNGSETYTYDLNNSGVYEVFPLSKGSESCQVKVFENVQGNQCSQTFDQSIDTGVTNQFDPFLYPNQYMNFNATGAAVQAGTTVAAGTSDQIGVVAAIYNYVIDNVPYDTIKAASVQSGYLPNMNVVLAQKKGICFDHAALMTAIFRSQDVPTKLVVGYTENLYYAWINVYLEGRGWVDNIIYFDGNSWELIDPTFTSSNGQSQEIIQYIGNGANYKARYSY